VAVVEFFKSVSALPAVLKKSSLYLVRVGTGFDLYATNSDGTIPHKINGPDMTTASVCVVNQPAPNSIEIDTRDSTQGGVATGATLGYHDLTISTIKNALDISAGSISEPLTAGQSVTIDANDEVTKSIAGNSFNSWFQSTNVIGNGSTEDFAVTWLVESVTGTIREMGGLDDNPGANNSYTSGEFMIYQVNGNSLYFYENGANMRQISYTLQVGDRLGIKIESQVARYIHIRGSVETVVHVSDKVAGGDYYFKGALNRGNASSGHSTMGDIQSHGTYVQTPSIERLSGPASQTITAEDVATLDKIGLIADPNSPYSLIAAQRVENANFPASTTYEITHGYYIKSAQSIVNF